MRFLSCLLFVACASGEPSVVVPPDSRPDSGQPHPPTAVDCPGDRHACGDTCMPRQMNHPDVGCALGCGEPCPSPSGGIARCTGLGTCDFTCTPGLARVGNACVAAVCREEAIACGQYVDAAGMAFDCGNCAPDVQCTNHACAIAPDAQEPNDVTPTALGDFDDADDAFLWVDHLSIDRPADEDWFRFHVADGFDAGNPDIAIELARRDHLFGWLDDAHELSVWFRCDTIEIGSRVSCGEWFTTSSENTLSDPTLGRGCTTFATFVPWSEIRPSCSGIVDGGTVTVRVRKRTPPRGDTYDLRVGVE